MRLRAFDTVRGNDADVDGVLRKFNDPPDRDSDFIIVKFGVVREADSATPIAFLFPPEIQHGEAIQTIMAQERQAYDVFLEFQGAGTIVAGPNDDCDMRIGWGSTTCMTAFGSDLLLDSQWANQHLAQLRDAIARRLARIGLPLSVDVLWAKVEEGPSIPAHIMNTQQCDSPCWEI